MVLFWHGFSFVRWCWGRGTQTGCKNKVETFPYACYNPSRTIYNGSGACPITVTSRPFYRRNTAPFKLRLLLIVYFLSKDDSLHSTRIRVIRLPYLPPNGNSRLFRWRSTRLRRVFRSSLHSALPREYERVAEETWRPTLRAKCPVEGPEKISEKEADFRYINLFKNIHTAVEEHIAFSPLTYWYSTRVSASRMGQEVDWEDSGVHAHRWLMGPKNEKAKLFYRRLGFEDIQGSGTNTGLQFDDWKGWFPRLQ